MTQGHNTQGVRSCGNRRQIILQNYIKNLICLDDDWGQHRAGVKLCPSIAAASSLNDSSTQFPAKETGTDSMF